MFTVKVPIKEPYVLFLEEAKKAINSIWSNITSILTRLDILEAKPIWHLPESLSVTTGTPTGSISDVTTLADGNVYQLVEVSGGLNVAFTFTGFSEKHISIALRSYYDGSNTHICLVQVFNNYTATWDTFIRLSNNTEYNYRYLSIDDAAPYILNGTVLVRFFHDTPATPGHDLFIDYLAIHN